MAPPLGPVISLLSRSRHFSGWRFPSQYLMAVTSAEASRQYRTTAGRPRTARPWPASAGSQRTARKGRIQRADRHTIDRPEHQFEIPRIQTPTADCRPHNAQQIRKLGPRAPREHASAAMAQYSSLKSLGRPTGCERRALFFDLGDISALAPRKLLRIAWARRFRKLHQFECYRP